MVCASWKRLVTTWISSFGLAVHFPYAESSWNAADGALALRTFKRLTFQERALQSGEATSAQRFPNAYHFTTAGDFAAWAEKKDTLINYQRLKEGTKTMTLDLGWVGEANRVISLEGMDLNSDGFLLVRLHSGASIYAPEDLTLPHTYRDFVYSLVAREIVWKMDSTDIGAEEWPQYTPLCIGKDRVYLAYRTSNKAYDLVAEDFRTGTRLYRTTVMDSIFASDRAYMPWRSLELIQLGSDEFMIQFDSKRLLSRSRCMVDNFAIINGADGRIQTIACPGLGKCNRAFANARTNSIALVEGPVFPYAQEMVVQKLSQRPDKTFLRTAVHVVSMPPLHRDARFVMHPFSFHAFSIQEGDAGPQAVTLTHDYDVQTCSKMHRIISRCEPEVVVDWYRCIVPGRPTTLPPRNPNRGGRRTLGFRVKPRDASSLTMLDDGRLLFEYETPLPGIPIRISRTTQWDTDMYLFSFAPKSYRHDLVPEAEGEGEGEGEGE
ncbi:hypothetical protein CLAIMM_05075 [Cladophialophora immunda]|nr:hypothetical protein CLAIMM_05075 [Cladophialophora immunda]